MSRRDAEIRHALQVRDEHVFIDRRGSAWGFTLQELALPGWPKNRYAVLVCEDDAPGSKT